MPVCARTGRGPSIPTATWVLIAAIAGSSMMFIDGTAVNVALPLVQRELHAGAGDLQWVVEGYTLFLCALILVGGALGDRFGRRSVFVIGVALFAAASLACALAPAIGFLIAARCVQGAGAAFATPGSLALISANFSGEARGRAIGSWSGFSAVTAAVGPVLGGWLAQTFSWRSVFFINLPLALIVIAVALLRVPESRDDDAPRGIDLTGAALATLSLGALVLGLIGLQTEPHGRLYAALAFGGCALAVLFLAYERRIARDPMLRPDLFRSRPFVGANVYTFLLYAALGGSLYFVPFDLINVQGYTPVAAGAALLPFIVIMFVASRWSGGLVNRIGARVPLVVGAAFAALGFLAFARTGIGGSYWTTFFPAAVLLGVGGAFFVAPLTTTVMDSVNVSEAGVASGVNNAVARTAGLVAIAGLGLVLAAAFDARLDRESTQWPASTKVAVAGERSAILSGAIATRDVPAEERDRVVGAIRVAYVAGFAVVMIASALLAAAAGVLAAFWDLRLGGGGVAGAAAPK